MYLLLADPTNGQEGVTQKLAETGKEFAEKVGEAGQDTWTLVYDKVTQVVAGHLPNVVAALAVLVVGWIIALIISAVIRGVMRRFGLGERLAAWSGSEAGREAGDVSRGVGRAVFYLIMLFVLVAFFQALGLAGVTEPLKAFLNTVFEYAPRLIAAAVLLFIAWVVATVLRFIVRSVLVAAQLDRRISRQAGVETEDDLPLTKTLSEATYWLTFLLFLPALLDALGVQSLTVPIQDMMTKALGFVPNLFVAAVIFGIGWFVARIIRRIAENVLAAVGADSLSDRVGLAGLMGNNRLSGVLGLLVYILILVPVVIASLDALQLEALTTPASDMLTTILGTLPGIFAAVVVVGVAYVVARLVSGLATNMLAGIGFDSLPGRLGLAGERPAGARSPSEIAGLVVMVAIVLFAVMQALPMMGFDLLGEKVSEFLAFAANVLMGLVIFGFGLYFAKLVGDAIRDSAITNANLLSTAARVSILVVAGAMGLLQTGLGEDIVKLAFGIVAGALAVAAAIAFGIGGRDAAKSFIDGAVKSQKAKD
ncbi:MAG: hypothetical protein DWQ42_22065 [Planctomycetota bacterium]|nr:MAG: hypothetical protein DWQ42_22065 [Planctomycetota bacterium]REK47456.1 MAG: hypothetical protein DWQ46_04300 [Planctomycetota bacterium]